MFIGQLSHLLSAEKRSNPSWPPRERDSPSPKTYGLTQPKTPKSRSSASSSSAPAADRRKFSYLETQVS
ncbi:hypothetical protein CDL12_22281 [Handroanthus impetiginosus]|uniref:Uncharacterized protein n=1 Tax=Handroanthus impetiginosus TaxID=429701 RepID=A0A2G9GIS4_9LAMI|nr:hypothetical protein CDL12_22281 [Handroanthus impetiginosus]